MASSLDGEILPSIAEGTSIDAGPETALGIGETFVEGEVPSGTTVSTSEPVADIAESKLNVGASSFTMSNPGMQSMRAPFDSSYSSLAYGGYGPTSMPSNPYYGTPSSSSGYGMSYGMPSGGYGGFQFNGPPATFNYGSPARFETPRPAIVQQRRQVLSEPIDSRRTIEKEEPKAVWKESAQRELIKNVRAMDPEAIHIFKSNPEILSQRWRESLQNFLERREVAEKAGMKINVSNGLNVPSGLHGLKEVFNLPLDQLAEAMRFQIYIAQRIQQIEWANTKDLKWAGFSVKPSAGDAAKAGRRGDQNLVKHLLALSASELFGIEQVQCGELGNADVQMVLPTSRSKDHADLSRKAFPDTRPKHPSGDKHSFENMHNAIMKMTYHHKNADSAYWTPELIARSNKVRLESEALNKSIHRESISVAWQQLGSLSETFEAFLKYKHGEQEKLYRAQCAEVVLKIEVEGYTYAESRTKEIKSWDKTYCAPFYKLCSIGAYYEAKEQLDKLNNKQHAEYIEDILKDMNAAHKIWKEKNTDRAIKRNRNSGERYAHYEQDKMTWPAIMPMKLAVYLMMATHKDSKVLFERNETDGSLPGNAQLMACRLFKAICVAYSENYGKAKIIERMDKALTGDLSRYKQAYHDYIALLESTDMDRAYAAALSFGKIKAGANVWVDAKATSGLAYCGNLDKVLDLYCKEREDFVKKCNVASPHLNKYQIEEEWDARKYFSTAASVYRKWLMNGSADRNCYLGFVHGVYAIGAARIDFGGDDLIVEIKYKTKPTEIGFIWDSAVMKYIASDMVKFKIFKQSNKGTHRPEHLSMNITGLCARYHLDWRIDEVWKWDSKQAGPYADGHFPGCVNMSSCCYGNDGTVNGSGAGSVIEADVEVE